MQMGVNKMLTATIEDWWKKKHSLHSAAGVYGYFTQLLSVAILALVMAWKPGAPKTKV